MAKQTTEHKEVIRLLKEHGAVLERTKKHHIWRFSDGRIHVLPSSPSCVYAWKNQLSDLRKFLGLVASDRGTPGERRPKKTKKQPEAATFYPAARTERSQLSAWDKLMAFREQLPRERVHVADPEWAFMGQFPELQWPTTKSRWWNPLTWI